MSVAGAVAEPMTLRVPLGVTLAECVAAAGGATIDDPNYIVGGVMMGRLENQSQRPGRQDHRRRHCVARRPWRHSPLSPRLEAGRADRYRRVRPVQLLHRIVPTVALGPSDRAASGDEEPRVQHVGEANVIGTAFCCECNLCSMVSCPEGPRPEERLHPKQAPVDGREEALREPAVQSWPADAAYGKPQKRRPRG